MYLPLIFCLELLKRNHNLNKNHLREYLSSAVKGILHSIIYQQNYLSNLSGRLIHAANYNTFLSSRNKIYINKLVYFLITDNYSLISNNQTRIDQN